MRRSAIGFDGSVANFFSFARGCETHSLHLFQKFPRFTQQRLNPPSLGNRIPGEQAVPARVLV
jgi:hypothetical protein